MIASDFKDIDGFRLQFEESVPDDERTYYMRTFLRVDDVSKDRVHCTTCDMHVGTAPISEKIIRTHQILGVTQCNKCFAFYNSGEFGKGEDGSEYYCRWCGQGGEVFCCSTCPFVFCNKCIKDNLSMAYIKEIERNDDWSCFVCNKETLKRLRAQHWALRNFMNKQLEKIQNVNINSEEELNTMLNDDKSNCCPKKKRKQILKPTPAPVKRPAMNGGSLTSLLGPPAKKQVIAPTKMLKVPVNTNYHLTKPGPKPTPPVSFSKPKSNDEVVCTPDILGLFNNKNQSATQRPMSSTAPPPLIMRQNQRPTRPALPSGSGTPNPIYHTVNGYQIDLNQASRQEIFRLPNGKLIQVRKQPNSSPSAPQPRTGMFPMHPRTSMPVRPGPPNITTTSRMMRPPVAPQLRLSRPQVQQQRPQPQATSTSAQTGTPASTVFTQQNGSISVARAPQPDTPFGKAKTAFEDKIINGLEICQHTINKMITLTNSSSFKTSRNFSDLKELYIHLQYLFTYTSGKIKTLQDSLATNVEELAKYDKKLKEKERGEEDELEIVEQKQDVIEVLSDDDGDVPEMPAPQAVGTKRTAGPLSKKLPGEILPNEIGSENDQEIFSAIVATIQQTLARQPQDQMELLASCNYVSGDQKLLVKPAVKVERLEDTKSPIIKQYMIAIQQKRDQERSVSIESIEAENNEETDDDFPPLIPEVVMDENPNSDEGDESAATVDNDNQSETKSVENDNVESESTEKPTEDSSDVVEIPSDDDETEKPESAEEPKKEEELMELLDSQEESTAVDLEESNNVDSQKEPNTVNLQDEPNTVDSQEEPIVISSQEDPIVEADEPMETDATNGSVEDFTMDNTNQESTTVDNSVNEKENSAENGHVDESGITEDAVIQEEFKKIAENGIDANEVLETLIKSLDGASEPELESFTN